MGSFNDESSSFLLNISSQSVPSKARVPKKNGPAQRHGSFKVKDNNNVISEYDSGFSDSSLITAKQNSSFSNNKLERNAPSIKYRHNFGISNKKDSILQSQKKKILLGNQKKSTNFKSTIHNGKKIQLSSLFHNNPEVPHIETIRHQSKKETLFSDQTFDKMNLHPHLVSCLQSRFNITKVTEVQGNAIPVLLNGKDALVKSCTGSGKTLSYAIPVVQKLQEIRPKIQRSHGVYALVILPTRELALQSYLCFSNLTKAFTWIVPGYLIGGEKKKSEKARIRKGINILVSTPGRLLDHLELTSNLNLKAIQWLILDEADVLLDQGYEAAVLKILSFCSPEKGLSRQTVLLSATLSKGVEKMAGMSLNNPEYIDIANENATMQDLVVPSQLEQYVVVTPIKLRLVTLSAFIVKKCAAGNFKTLIFMATQNTIDFHFVLFREILKPMLKVKGHRIKFFKLHGNMKQEERTDIFNQFKTVDNGILLCTDVAARGLDLPLVDWIIQYSAPSGAENYVHRIGRTARIGHKGHALLFLIPSEIGFIQLLQERQLRINELYSKDILQSLLLIADAIHESEQQSRSVKTIEEHASKLQFKYESTVYSEPTLYDNARDAFLTFVQAYSTYPKSLKDVLPFKQLHLGHVAKAFCLRESPSELGCKFSKTMAERSKKFKQGFRKPPQKRKQSTKITEYDSGFSLMKAQHPRKKKKKA